MLEQSNIGQTPQHMRFYLVPVPIRVDRLEVWNPNCKWGLVGKHLKDPRFRSHSREINETLSWGPGVIFHT